MITWDPPWPCWSDSYLLPMLPITMSCGHSFTSMDSPTMMSELSNILWKPPWFDKAVLLELCSTLWKPSSLRPLTRALSLYTSLPCLCRLDSILLTNFTRLPDMTPWEPPCPSSCMSLDTSLPCMDNLDSILFSDFAQGVRKDSESHTYNW